MVQEINYEVDKRNQIISSTRNFKIYLVGASEDEVSSECAHFELIDMELSILVANKILGSKSEVDQMERCIGE